MQTRRTFLLMTAGAAASAQDTMFGDAQAYERFMGRWSRKLAPLLVEFAGVGGKPLRILDVGSGTGALSAAVAARCANCSITGIDPSTSYVAYATANAPQRSSFEVGDAQELSFPDGCFDACLSLLVFNFIPKPEKALAELSRVTRRGGTVAAAVWDYGGRMEMLRVFWDAIGKVDPAAAAKDESDMPLCRSGELAALWRSGGLTAVEEKPLDIEMRFASFEDFWDPFLLKTGPAGKLVAGLTPAQREALAAEMKKRLPASMTLRAGAWAVRGTAS